MSQTYQLEFIDMLSDFLNINLLKIPVSFSLPKISDLIQQINWLKNNDDKAKEIAINGYNLVKNYIHDKNNIFDYLAFCINAI